MALYHAYEGNVFRSFDLKSIVASLELAKSLNQTRAISDEIHLVLETADVKPFPLPIVVGDLVYVNAATYTTLDMHGELKIRNPVEYQLRVEEARWELVWKRNENKLGSLMAQFPYHHELLAKWISDAIAHTYSLAPFQAGQVKAAAALFSVGQFYNNFEDELKMLRLQQELSRQLGTPFELFESVTGHTEYLFPRTVEEFVELIIKADITPRLKDFSVSALQQLLSTSFFGISYDKQLCTSAIEYPPSLFVMTSACLSNNMFNRSRFGGMVKKSDTAKRKDKFDYTYNTVLNQFSKPTNVKG